MAGVNLIVGGWFASAIINKVVDKARTYFGNNQDLHASTNNMLNQLETALPQIQSVINLAERRPFMNPGIGTWLRQLKDATYEADDVLDDFEFIYLCDKKKAKSKVSALASSSFKAFKLLVFSDKDLKKLNSILKKLDGIVDGVGSFIQVLNLEVEERQETVVRGETSFLVSDDILFGRDNEREAIFEMLFPRSSDKPESHEKLGGGSSSSSALQVLPIVGIGGVGKTALARLYDYVDTLRQEDSFEVKTWAYVADNQDVKRLTEQMIDNLVVFPSLDGSTWARKNNFNYNSTTNVVQVKLRNILHKKRFFIVLDDVWDEVGTIWDELLYPLINGAEGSVVLVTTQSRTMAKMIGTIGPIVLDVLEENDYWRLFEYYAFGDYKKIEVEKLEELQPIGRQIASKLHGLPLAGKVMGRLLQQNLDVDHWRKVLESEWWQLEFGLKRILPSLGLSFQHLSVNLKQCFAYCSIFPKGYIFEKERLVQMWMAQGYIQPDKRKRRRMEDIGIEWFDELTSRLFFQPIWNNRFMMHDLMRELAVYVSLEECFVLKDDSGGIPQGIRHLSLRTDRLNVFIEDMDKLKGLRTVLFFGDYDSKKFINALRCLFENSRSLRVLDLSYNSMEIKTLPNSIYALSHLRYLDVSWTKFEYLPETLTRLFHLLVLNLRGCLFSNLPRGISDLIRLRHLYADADTLSGVSRIGKLTCLQELMEFRLKSKHGHRIGELEHMRELRGELMITNRENVTTKEEAMKAMLMEKEHLHSLQLKWNSNGSQSEEILGCLQPHYNLKELGISGYGGVTSPSWMIDSKCLSSLRSVHLIFSDNWNSLPPLGQLPFLKTMY